MATDEPKDKVTETTEDKDQVVEETSQEAPEETPQPDKTESKPQIDEDAIAEKVSKKASEDVIKKFAESLGLTKSEEDKATEDGQAPPWVKEKRNPKSYEEVAQYAADLAEYRRQQNEEKQKEELKKQEDEQKKTNDQWNKYWDDQLDDLVGTGKIPKIEDKNDPNDAGVLARKELFQKMYEVTQQRTLEGRAPVTSLKEVYYEHYKDPNAQPAGADAPVSPGKGAVSSGDKDSYSYDEIRKSSYEDILTGRK